MNELHLMTQAFRAAIYSPDKSTQNGSLLWRSGQIICTGWNHIPVKPKPEHHIRPLKYKYFEHAERDVIFKAARNGAVTKGSVMFCPYAACTDCARAIILAGVTEVFTYKPMMDMAPERWLVDIKIADEMMDERGIKRTSIDTRLDLDFELMFDEKPWRP